LAETSPALNDEIQGLSNKKNLVFKQEVHAIKDDYYSPRDPLPSVKENGIIWPLNVFFRI
jgi:hypothetical protein